MPTTTANLNKLKSAFPVASSQAANNANAARQTQLQSQMQQAGTQPVTPSTVQNLSAQQISQEGAIQTGEAARQSQQAVDQANLGLEAQAQEQAQSNIRDAATLERQKMDQSSRLKSMGRDIEDQLFNQRLAFDTRADQVKFANERQLADYLVSKSASDEEFRNFEQATSQASKKKIDAMNFAYNTFVQAETHLMQSEQNEQNREMLKRVRARKQEMEKAKAEMAKKASITRKIVGAGKLVAAAAVTYAGNPVTGSTLAASGASDLTS